jgi:accessory gene regulator protein AgrB
MSEKKAFRHALLTVGTAVLLVFAFLLYVAGPHSDFWPAFAFIILVPALIMLPFVYSRYVRGPLPSPTPQQHLKKAIWCGMLAVTYFVLSWMKSGKDLKSVWMWINVGIWALLALDHLRRAYTKEGDLSRTQ